MAGFLARGLTGQRPVRLPLTFPKIARCKGGRFADF